MRWIQALQDTVQSPGFWRRAALWALLLCLAPFAIEIIIMADLIGIELAMAFVAYWGRDLWAQWLARWDRWVAFCNESCLILASHCQFERRNFLVLCGFSVALVVLGSPLLASAGWLPLMVLAPDLSPFTGFS